MTGFATVESAVQAMKDGAYDYVTKPIYQGRTELSSSSVLANHLRLKSENRMLRERVRFEPGICEHYWPSTQRWKRFIASSGRPPIAITGSHSRRERHRQRDGRALHSLFWGLPGQAFIPVDCGSLVPTLIESELFGYVKGAFTGAVQAKDGLLSIAKGERSSG